MGQTSSYKQHIMYIASRWYEPVDTRERAAVKSTSRKSRWIVVTEIAGDAIPVMAGNYCVSAPRDRKSRMRNSWDCPFKFLADGLCSITELSLLITVEKH